MGQSTGEQYAVVVAGQGDVGDDDIDARVICKCPHRVCARTCGIGVIAGGTQHRCGCLQYRHFVVYDQHCTHANLPVQEREHGGAPV